MATHRQASRIEELQDNFRSSFGENTSEVGTSWINDDIDAVIGAGREVAIVESGWRKLSDSVYYSDFVHAPYVDTTNVSEENTRVYRFEKPKSDTPVAVKVTNFRPVANDVIDCEYSDLKQYGFVIPDDIISERKKHPDVSLLMLLIPDEPVDVVIAPMMY